MAADPPIEQPPVLDAEVERKIRSRLESWIPDMVKRTLSAGVEAVSSSEEVVRRLTKDMTLPREVAGYLASTAGATKDELLRIIASEVREFLQNVNLSDEIARMLTTLSFEIKTEIRFIPNEEKLVKPDVKAQVALKKVEREKPRRRRVRRKKTDE